MCFRYGGWLYGIVFRNIYLSNINNRSGAKSEENESIDQILIIVQDCRGLFFQWVWGGWL